LIFSSSRYFFTKSWKIFKKAVSQKDLYNVRNGIFFKVVFKESGTKDKSSSTHDHIVSGSQLGRIFRITLVASRFAISTEVEVELEFKRTFRLLILLLVSIDFFFIFNMLFFLSRLRFLL